MTEELEKLIQKSNDRSKANKEAQNFMRRDTTYLLRNSALKVAVDILQIHDKSGLAICENNKKVIGYISCHDLIIHAASRPSNSEITDIILPAITVFENTKLKDIVKLFYKKKLKQVPVVDENLILKGYITRIDILNVLVQD